ncbi:hypothetical protein MTO96_048613 [Rhipicephalus appendiculatus]
MNSAASSKKWSSRNPAMSSASMPKKRMPAARYNAGPVLTRHREESRPHAALSTCVTPRRRSMPTHSAVVPSPSRMPGYTSLYGSRGSSRRPLGHSRRQSSSSSSPARGNEVRP